MVSPLFDASLFLPAAGLLGLVWGSFANVLIHRLPRGESVVSPGSRCPACAAPIRWFQNVPLLSWVALRGRCASCRTPISPRYPLVEAAMGGLFLACAAAFGPSPASAIGALFSFLALCLGLIDLEHQILPDRLTLPGIALGLGSSFFVPWTTPWASLLGAVLGAALPAALIGAYALFSVEAMGWGDVKLLAMLGAFLGWKGMLLALFGGALIGTLAGGAYLLAAGKDRRTPLPFGTFLCAAGLGALFWGPAFWSRYQALLLPSPP
ncbi:MAG: prepilin peptidase [Acidobacteriota bacterium]